VVADRDPLAAIRCHCSFNKIVFIIPPRHLTVRRPRSLTRTAAPAQAAPSVTRAHSADQLIDRTCRM
jgi:hypothetical protein